MPIGFRNVDAYVRGGKGDLIWGRRTSAASRSLLVSLIVSCSGDHQRTTAGGGEKATSVVEFPSRERRLGCAARVLKTLSADSCGPRAGPVKAFNDIDVLADSLYLAPSGALPELPAPLQRLCTNVAATSETNSTLMARNAQLLLQQALSARSYKVPDVEGASLHRCSLTRSSFGRRFASREVNQYLAAIFQLAITTAAEVGADFKLSRYDLYHGHLFLSAEGLGILLHAQEYPALEEEAFPVHLGYCQAGSPVQYDVNNMNYRNILWTTRQCQSRKQSHKQTSREGVLAVLDTSPGSPLYDHLIMEGLRFVRTIDESDFGHVLADVNYFHSLSNRKPEHRVYLHLPQ
mmetsp:Transcript_15952/g.34599  ORF Transcript_15952/g.34599 Transcript_15952/m.34599 type:complete len:348 (-) Transcript_15952:10-1053(-)